MNVFYTHIDPIRSVYNLDDKRIAKMALESAQILQGAVWNARYGDVVPTKPRKDDPPYRVSKAQRHHPCMSWAGNRENYRWLLKHFEALCFEHTTRYPNKLVLSVYLQCYGYCRDHADDIPEGSFTEPRALMFDPLASLAIPVTGRYKVYLAHKYLYTDKRKTTFGNRAVPKFLTNEPLVRYLHSEFGKPLHGLPTTVVRI